MVLYFRTTKQPMQISHNSYFRFYEESIYYQEPKKEANAHGHPLGFSPEGLCLFSGLLPAVWGVGVHTLTLARPLSLPLWCRKQKRSHRSPFQSRSNSVVRPARSQAESPWGRSPSRRGVLRATCLSGVLVLFYRVEVLSRASVLWVNREILLLLFLK